LPSMEKKPRDLEQLINMERFMIITTRAQRAMMRSMQSGRRLQS